jgi:GT2 family glycosyltransferase
MKLSIIIVNYNACDLLKECIESIKKSINGMDYEIIVVDNNSWDGSVDMLGRCFPDVRVIANKDNKGFAKANNQGYEVSRGEYVLLLNNDTIVLQDAINKLVSFSDRHPEAAIAGPKLLNSDLTLQLPCRRGFPRFLNSLAYFTRVSKLFPRNKVLGSYLMTYRNSNQSHEVDAVSGAGLLARRSAIKSLGMLLDEDFFFHFEDIDFCYRTKKHGYRVYYVHDAEIIHLKGQSSKLRSEGVVRNFYESALLYFHKNYKGENAIAYYLLVFIIKVMETAYLLLFRMRAFYRGKGQSK